MSRNSLVPRDCRAKGRSRSFARVPAPVLISGRKRPSGQPRSTAGRFYVRVVSCRCTCSRITNTRVTGYRTLASLASDSPPRRPLLRRACQDPARPDPTRQAATALGAPRVPATETRQPGPALGSLRRSPHFGSRSAPSRAALLAWLMAESPGLSPLTARFAAAPPRASRSDTPGQVDITNRSHQQRIDSTERIRELNDAFRTAFAGDERVYAALPPCRRSSRSRSCGAFIASSPLRRTTTRTASTIRGGGEKKERGMKGGEEREGGEGEGGGRGGGEGWFF